MRKVITRSSTLGAWGVLLTSLMCHSGAAQNIAGTVSGNVTDPSTAVVAGAEVKLTDASTGAVRTVRTQETGRFVIPGVLPGSYVLEVSSKGFQTYRREAVNMTAGEIRDLGTISLTLGQVGEAIVVQDTPAVLQTGSAEISTTVTSNQVEDLALRGRDFFAFVGFLPGVVDLARDSRNSTTGEEADIIINGARGDMKNFTVDGVTTLDTGSQTNPHFQPNLDTIAEIKVLTSNYQAEYGRNAGGLINVTTKGGTQKFRGTAWWTHRHEQFNANAFFRNRTGLGKSPYRYDIYGFGVGGPITIPGKFNSDRSKLFFFFSEEWTRTLNPSSITFRNVPSLAERNGDYSRSLDVNGRLIPVTDPLTGRPFGGNVIPANRIHPLGQKILKYFPEPNWVDPDPALVYRQNYRASATQDNSKRNDTVRIDVYPSSKLTAFVRFTNEPQDTVIPFPGVDYLDINQREDRTGGGWVVQASYSLSPTRLNVFKIGHNYMSLPQTFAGNRDRIAQGAIGDFRQWYPDKPQSAEESEAFDATLLPNISFGGTPVNTSSISINDTTHVNRNPTWDIADDFNWVFNNHSVRAGIYYNHTDKTQISGYAWNGIFNFGRDTYNPLESGHGFANALLGNINSYTESTQGLYFNPVYYGLEFYVQDNWKATRSLTVDYGIRFYNFDPQWDRRKSFGAFFPGLYDPAKVPVLYGPGLDAQGRRVAVDPRNGRMTYPVLIGTYVPGTGNPANGFQTAGEGGTPRGIFSARPLELAPRFGLAYDVGRRGKTVIRLGAGVFYDRMRQLLRRATAVNPPVVYAPTAYYTTLDTYYAGGDVLGPTNVAQAAPGEDVPYPAVVNYSLSVQQAVPRLDAVLSAAYVGNFSRHLAQTYMRNPIPMYARFDPANRDPSNPTAPLADNFLRAYYSGVGNVNQQEFSGNANYNSVQLSLNRRFRSSFGFGLSYTFSKALGTATSWSTTVSPYFNARSWNYGPLTFDRAQVFSVNYTWDLPNLGAKLRNKMVGAVTDHWTVAGITQFISGGPFTPGFSTTVSTDTTGSSEGARITVVGDPRLEKGQKTFDRNFNTSAFALTRQRTFGNAGVGVLRGPGVNNWDISLRKDFPLWREDRSLQFRAEFYNAFNHTQFNGLDSSARFTPAGEQVNARFGAFTSALSPRIVSFSLRLRF